MRQLLQTTQAYRLLKNEMQRGTNAHAYLLLFEDARNLPFAMRTFAKLFFGCDTPKNTAEQRTAELIENGSFADCLFYPKTDKKLTVDDAAEIVEESLLAPVEQDKKLFLLADFADANAPTQNKLLKLLEEPPQNVLFLLGATKIHSVLPTVLSRVKTLEIPAFSQGETTACLARIYGEKYDKDSMSLCAATAGGIVGVAQNFLESERQKALLSSAFDLALASPSSLPVAIKKIAEIKHKKELLSLLRLVFRDALVLKTAPTAPILLQARKNNVLAVCEKYTLPALLYAQTALSEAELQVNFNAVFPQCVELCIAKIQAKN